MIYFRENSIVAKTFESPRLPVYFTLAMDQKINLPLVPTFCTDHSLVMFSPTEGR